MSYGDFKGKLATFNEYIAAENQSIDVESLYDDNAVVSVEIGGNMKTMICNLLAGKGLKPAPQIQICLDMNLNELLFIASGNAALMGALAACRSALQAFNQHTGLSATLARLNAVMGEAAAIASMINFCANPINPKPIPNVLETIMGSFLGAGEAILNRLGRVIPDRAKFCFDFSTGTLNTDAFIDGGLLDDIRKAFDAGIDTSGLWEDWVAQLHSIADDFTKVIRLENDVAKAATENKGLGSHAPGAVDALQSFPDLPPEVVLFQPTGGGKVTPLTTTKVNSYDTSLTYTRFTFDVAIKFSERMDPDTVVARLANQSGLSQGTYGTVVISQAGTELVWATRPQNLDDSYSRYGGTVRIDNTSTYTTDTFAFYVGSNYQFSPTTPTSRTKDDAVGKQMINPKNINFTCNPAIQAVAGTGAFVGVALPGQSDEEQKLGTGNYPDLPTAMNNAQNIMALWKQLAGYPIQRQDGTILTNIFDAFLDDDTKALVAAGENYIAPVYTQVAEKDYCGNITGYKYVFTQGALETPDLVAADTLSTLLTERPIVLEVTPNSNATDILIDATIKLRFSQNMDSSTFTIGDTRTTWDPNITYVVNDIIEYVGKEYKSILTSNLNRIPSLNPLFWEAVTSAQTTAGTGTVRMIDTSLANKHVEGTISYTSTNNTMTYTPSSNLIASHVYEIKVVGANTSTADKVSPIENISGVTMTNTFSSSFTVSATGASSGTGVVVTAAGSTVGLPQYTVAELLGLAVFAADTGSMAWCTNDNSSGSLSPTTVVYNGTNWVRVDNGFTISA